jgi:AraC family transcriptional regulator of adaptative response/methylated-DNA-[protein]-cysteine methyltransferase
MATVVAFCRVMTLQMKSPQAALDYARVEKAIHYLQRNFLEQPDLETLARSANTSAYHFQRLFSRWAGISPKKFLRYLTCDFAQQRLRESRSVLDATFESGLSSPGRLHDLLVSIHAVTPGEYKSHGKGIEISYGFHPTRWGRCLLAVTTRGICGLSFDDGTGAGLQELRQKWRGAKLVENPSVTAPIAEKIFATRRHGKIDLLLMGTNFQLKVWEALLKIPAGNVVSYRTIGEWIGRSTASRAVGTAIGSNSIAYLIPCHRVIRSTGMLGGFRWGTARKQAMLGCELAGRS